MFDILIYLINNESFSFKKWFDEFLCFLAQLFNLLCHESTMGAAIFVFCEINLRCDWDYSEIKSAPVIG